MAEVVTKRRGRPPKNQQQQQPHEPAKIDGDRGSGDIVAAPKSRARPASRASVASTTKSSKAAKQTVEELVVDASTITGEKKPKASAAKRKETAVASKTPDTARSRKSPAPTTTTTSLADQHDASTRVITEGKTKAPKSVAKTAEASRSAQKSRLATTPTTPTPTTTPAADIVYPRASISTILGHAKAFSKQSDQLQLDILRAIAHKEAVYSSQHLSSPRIEPRPRQTPEAGSQISSAADATPVPVDETASMPPLVGEASITAVSVPAASNSSPKPAMTNEAGHAFSTQTLASLSPQQSHAHAHAHPPPSSSVLSSPLGPAQGPQHQVRPYSSTKALPMSTTIALAARQQSKPSMPPRPQTIPPEVPPASPKLSDLPLEQLKKDPRYRKASTRYTTFVVALPFAIVSSYFLWERYREHQTYLQKVRDARAKVPGPDDLASSTAVSVPGQHDRE